MKTHRTLSTAVLLIGCLLILPACNAPFVLGTEQADEPVPTSQPPTPTQQVERIQLDPCSLLSEAEVSPVLGGTVQMQPAQGTGGCSYMLSSDDPTVMAQLILSAAQGEEAKTLTLLSIGILAGFSGDPNMMAEFEALNDQLPELSLPELVSRLADLFQGTGISVIETEAPGESALWLLYESDAYSQGTLILVRDDEYVSLTQIGSDMAAAPDQLTRLAETAFERLPPAFYVLGEDSDGSFSFEYSGGEEPEEIPAPTETEQPLEIVGGLVWVTAPNAGQVYAIDPMTNEVTATIDVGRFPTDIAVTDGQVWVVSDTEGTVWRIDPESFEVAQTIPLGGNTLNIDAGSDALWVVGGLGVRMIDLNTGTRHDVVYNRCYDVAIGEDVVWVSQTQDKQLLQIDPESRRVVATVKLDGQPTWIAYGHGIVWTVLSDTKELAAVDPSTGQVVDTEPFKYAIHGMAVGPNRLWYTRPTQLNGIEAWTWDIDTIVPTSSSIRIAYYAGSLWTTGGEEGVVTRYDPEDGRTIATIEVGADPVGIAAGQ